jgi:hypothetical protein
MDQIEKSRIIYHYTDENGAKGIIESQSLWLTHYMHLNDKSELSIFRSALNEWIKASDIQDRLILGHMNIIMTPIWGDPSKTPEKEGYVMSFCDDEGDRLSQWRAYGKGRGIALGFDEKELKILLENEHKINKLDTSFMGDVSYGNGMTLPKDIITDLEKFVEVNSEKKLTEMLSEGKGKEYAQAAAESEELLMKCLSRFKHEGFSEEKEVRIITFVPVSVFRINEKGSKKDTEMIKFRTVDSAIIPYKELFEGRYRLPIKKIFIGPSPDIEVRKHTLQILLKNNNMDSEMVKISKIPYRGR